MGEIKVNLEGIHLDMDELIKRYGGKIGSCSDGTEIQQISLFCQMNRNDYRKPVLMDMINPTFAYAGLYPEVQRTYDILPEHLKEVVGDIDMETAGLEYPPIKLPLSSIYGTFGENKDGDDIMGRVSLEEVKVMVKKMFKEREMNRGYEPLILDHTSLYTPEKAKAVTESGRKYLKGVMIKMNEMFDELKNKKK